FQGNLDGSKKIFELVKPLVEHDAPAFVARIESNFAALEDTLANYHLSEGDASKGFQTYDKVSERDRRALVGPVTVLAEELSTLRGMLGLD
ncbi:MAG TPA: EfeM/EfeO family lipoprotein, partial [Pseudomonas pachastrellae]|nr:EfeM/EfeO family lipoprotein [Halopseudomonas pachastrellae]